MTRMRPRRGTGCRESFSDVVRRLPGAETGRGTVGREGWRGVLEAFRRQGELDDLRRETFLGLPTVRRR